MGESQPKRSRFQFHLLTAVVLPPVAGWLLLENISIWSTGYEAGHGWPFRITRDWSDFGGSRNTAFFGEGLIGDFIFDAVLLLAVFWICERLTAKNAKP